jgi:hypothetical protein
MDDPIPAGFITLPEALQRIAVHVSDAHLESMKLDFQNRAQAIAAIRRDREQSAGVANEPPITEAAAVHVSDAHLESMKLDFQSHAQAIAEIQGDGEQNASTTNEPPITEAAAVHVSDARLESVKLDFQDSAQAIAAIQGDGEQNASATNQPPITKAADSVDLRSPSEEACHHWNKQNFVVSKLGLALQTGAISAMVRAPESGSLFRLTQNGWHLEPCWEQIVRGGVIPLCASKGFECHQARTVLIEPAEFEAWLRSEVKDWPEPSKQQLCFNWLVREMRASPNDRKKTKAQWREAAKARFRVSGREFDIAWSDAVEQTGSNWNRPGAPPKSSR